MPEEFSVPPEVLETLQKVLRMLETMVVRLEPLTVAPGTSAVARPKTVQAKAHIPTPVVATMSAALPSLTGSFAARVSEPRPPELPTVEQARMSLAWMAAVKNADTTLKVIGIPLTVWGAAKAILEALA